MWSRMLSRQVFSVGLEGLRLIFAEWPEYPETNPQEARKLLSGKFAEGNAEGLIQAAVGMQAARLAHERIAQL